MQQRKGKVTALLFARNPRGHDNYWHGSGLNRKRI